MLWINEGFTLDDAGNVVSTSYVDLRDEGEMVTIRSLVKGCRREHALEDGENILISKPERFREYGPALIRDEQEGFAREERVTVEAETPEEAARRRAASELNDVLRLVGSGEKFTRRVEHSRRKTQSESLSYGKDWWIFCASIRPEEGEWATWRATLDEDYDHVSDIGQPAKFAQALAKMVVEQVGSCGEEAWVHGTSDGPTGARTRHKHQWVVHGPVVYTDRLYDTLSGEEDDVRRMAACLFTKPISHAAQREYRFVVFNGGADEQTVLLQISGMMRDALARTERGLVRPSPTPAETVGGDGAPLPRPLKGAMKERAKHVTVTERTVEKEERRLETRNADGQVLSSDVKRLERVGERVGTKASETGEREIPNLRGAQQDEDAALERSNVTTGQGSEATGDAGDEGAAARELALDEREWNDGKDRDEFAIPVVLHGSGRAYRSLEKMFEDPAAPLPIAGTTWEISACSPQEIVKSYNAVATLAMKILRVAVEHQQEAASACWHALQCINHIHARLGDIVDCVWIERDRFVVIRLQKSEALKATGRIVIGPSGVYAYCFRTSRSEQVEHCDGIVGMLAFPLGAHVEAFESYGWPGKPENVRVDENKGRDL